MSSANQAQLWDIDLPDSTILMNTSTFADDFTPPGFVQVDDRKVALNPGFIAPAGTFDFGNAATSVAKQGGITSSSNAFVTASGDLRNTLQVRQHTQRLGTPQRGVLWRLDRRRRG